MGLPSAREGSPGTVALAGAERRSWTRFLRPAVSAVLLGLLLQRVGLGEVWQVVTQASLPLLGAGVLLVVLALVVSAYKWQQLLRAQGIGLSLWWLFTSYLVGLFFNNFLPTNIGGDVMRIHDVARRTGRASEAAASVIGERLLASVALGLTAGAGLLLSLEVSKAFGGVVAGLLGLSLFLVLLLSRRGWQRALSSRLSLPDWFGLRRGLTRLTESLAQSLASRRVVAWVIVLSVVFHLVVVLLSYTIFVALGAEVALVQCVLFIPLISAIQMLPVSVNGLGVREASYVYFFGTTGLGASEAVAASLLFWGLVSGVSLAGGVVFALRR